MSHTIDVQILGRNYAVSCPKEEVETLQAAANHVNFLMHDLRKQAPNLDHEKMLVLTCLNLCSELFVAQKNEQEVKQSTRLLEKMIMETRQYLRS